MKSAEIMSLLNPIDLERGRHSDHEYYRVSSYLFEPQLLIKYHVDDCRFLTVAILYKPWLSILLHGFFKV